MAVELWLVRHGQAAFATDDYDRLTDLGRQQAAWLGEHLAGLGLGFDRIAAGELKRQQQTAAILAEHLDGAVETVPGLEEYSADRLLIEAGYPLRDPSVSRREHFRRLRTVLADWAAEKLTGAESWAEFDARTGRAVEQLTGGGEGRVLAASSGGAIAMIVTRILGLDPAWMIEFNLQARNSGITRLVFARERVYLNMFNAIPHLEHPDRIHAETYS